MSALNLSQYLTLKVKQFEDRIFLRDFGSQNHYTYQDLANDAHKKLESSVAPTPAVAVHSDAVFPQSVRGQPFVSYSPVLSSLYLAKSVCRQKLALN